MKNKEELAKAEPYCVKCKSKLILKRIEITTKGELSHYFYCKNCDLLIHENDKTKIYWSNYEWMYKEEEREW